MSLFTRKMKNISEDITVNDFEDIENVLIHRYLMEKKSYFIAMN